MTRERCTSALPGNLNVALGYAAQGLVVFPCHPATKAPLIAHGFRGASKEDGRIRAWWQSWPQAIVGLPTGPDTARWVLDVDIRDDKGGDEALLALERTHGKLPLTPMALTPSGGFHLHFAYPAARRVVTRSNVWRGIDVRGDGGYVIAPGSVGARGRWEWEASQDPDEGLPLASAPEWLLAAVCGSSPRAGLIDPKTVLASPSDPGTEAGFFERVNALALQRLAAWVPNLFPAARIYHDGYRVTSAALGRALEEDLSIVPGGIKDFGEGRTETPVGLVLRWGTAATPAAAAFWLCERLGINPEALGWRTSTVFARELPPLDSYAGDLDQGGVESRRPGLRVVGGTEHDSRPTVDLVNGELPEAVDAAEAHLIEARADIFQHGTRLVRVGQWEAVPGPVDRPHGAGVLIDISPEWLSDTLTRHIRWRRFDARQSAWKRIDAPGKVASTLLARVGSWRFPALVGFCDSPTLDLAGRVVASPGYDPPSGLYLSHPPPVGAIGAIGRLDVEGAGDALYEAVSTFPFVSDADRSACLALILTALLRRVLPAAPIGCVSANTPGTGKSKLVDAISAIVTGRPAAVAAIGTTPEELEKRVDAVLLKGDTVCAFDNVDRPIKSDVLCQVATQQVKSIRVMGLSKIVEAPTNVCLMMTGNNLTLVGDLVRRCLVVNLDAGCERPELRECDAQGRPFRDAIGYVLGRRSELIRAALVIIKAYLDAGCPTVQAPPFGSFEVWDRMVRRPLLWAGWPDPLAPAESMRDQDHELAGMREFLRAWKTAAPEPLTAAELAGLIRERVPLMASDWAPKCPELQDAAIQVMGDLSKWGARELGYRLRAMAGRLFDGLRIVKAHGHNNSVRWSVRG